MSSTTTVQAVTDHNRISNTLPSFDDPRYFPRDFSNYLLSCSYAPGMDPHSFRKYIRDEIQRGRDVVQALNSRLPVRGKRVLDVGCGYAGLLITMIEAGAASATGVEVNQERLVWGKKRLVSLDLTADIQQLDICDSRIMERLGTFDIILAQDVMEHVADPSTAIQNIGHMLRPGGAVYLQVGNKFSPDQLVGDHHYALPGITMLSRPQAIEYFCTRLHQPESAYAVGCWRDEKFYRNAFRRHGIEFESVTPMRSIEHVVWYANTISEMCIQLKQNLWPDLRPELGKRMSRRMKTLAAIYAHACQKIVALAEKQPELLPAACDALTGRLLTGVLRLVGRKSAQAPARKA